MFFIFKFMPSDRIYCPVCLLQLEVEDTPYYINCVNKHCPKVETMNYITTNVHSHYYLHKYSTYSRERFILHDKAVMIVTNYDNSMGYSRIYYNSQTEDDIIFNFTIASEEAMDFMKNFFKNKDILG